jgi:hypothetical protein
MKVLLLEELVVFAFGSRESRWNFSLARRSLRFGIFAFSSGIQNFRGTGPVIRPPRSPDLTSLEHQIDSVAFPPLWTTLMVRAGRIRAAATEVYTGHTYRRVVWTGTQDILCSGLLTMPALNRLLSRPRLYEHAIPSPYNYSFLPRYPSRSFFIKPYPPPPNLSLKKNSCGRMSAPDTELPTSLSPRLLTLPLLRFNHPLVPFGSNQIPSVCVCVYKEKEEYLTPNINEMVSRLCA